MPIDRKQTAISAATGGIVAIIASLAMRAHAPSVDETSARAAKQIRTEDAAAETAAKRRLAAEHVEMPCTQLLAACPPGIPSPMCRDAATTKCWLAAGSGSSR